MRHHAHAVHACESASRLVCEHTFLAALVPIALIVLVVAGSAAAAWCSTRARPEPSTNEAP